MVTVHDGYGYLLQEFGLEVAGVVQPSHGLTPSAPSCATWCGCCRKRKSRSSSAKRRFHRRCSRCCSDEAGVKVYIISHIASGPFTADRFEREMQTNVETMIRALVTEG